MVETAQPELTDAYRDHYGRLVRLAYSITGRKDDAEELVQEAFISAQQRWRTVSGYDDPSAWLRHVVVNRCLSFHRKSNSEARALSIVGSREMVARQVNATDVPLTDADNELWTAVRELPRMQAAVIGLLFIADQTAADAAHTLGCSEDTVRTHLRRAKVTLAARLATPSTDVESPATPKDHS